MRLSERLKRIVTAPNTLVLIILTGLWVLFFWRLLTPDLNDRVIFQKGDFPLHFFSYIDYQIERIRSGQIPLWNPYNYGGDPFAANVQLAVWYPPRWATIIITKYSGWSIEALQFEVAAHYWLSSVMMYAFLRTLIQPVAGTQQQRRVLLPALAGSILWTYGGYLTGYPMMQPSVLLAITWFPLMMLGAHLSVTQGRWRVQGILLSGGMMGLSLLGGHPQTTMQMTYCAAAYIAYVGWQHKLAWKSSVGRIVLMGITGVALSAIQLIPALEFTRLTFRVETYHYAEKSAGFMMTEFAQALWPRLFNAEYWPLYLGVVGLLLAVGAILRLRKEHHFWIATMVVAVWLSLGGNSVVYDLFYLVVPGINVFRDQERVAALAVFALSVLASYQLAWLLMRQTTPEENSERDHRRFRWIAHAHLVFTTLIYVIFVLIVLIRGDSGTQDTVSHTMGFVALVSLFFTVWLLWQQKQSIRHSLVPITLLLLVVIDLFSFGIHSPNFVEDTPFNHIQPPDNRNLLSQPMNNIQWHVDGAAGIQTYGTYWRIPDIYGTGAFKLASIEKLRQIRVDRRWEVLAVRYATMTAEVPKNVPITAISDGVNYDGEEYVLYELTDPRPFAHLVYDVRVSDEGKSGARDIMKEPHINLREIGVITAPLSIELSGERPAESTVNAFNMDMPEYMEMSVSTSENALLTLPVANYPGWQATVNSRRVEIVDTYAGLIGIPLEAGKDQKITLRFFPKTIIIGGIISALALIAVVGYAVIIEVQNRRILSATEI